jgi:hypothetical protein
MGVKEGCDNAKIHHDIEEFYKTSVSHLIQFKVENRLGTLSSPHFPLCIIFFPQSSTSPT